MARFKARRERFVRYAVLWIKFELRRRFLELEEERREEAARIIGRSYRAAKERERNTYTLNTPYHLTSQETYPHTLSTHILNLPYQPTLSLNPLITASSQSTLSLHPLSTQVERRLRMRSDEPSYEVLLVMHCRYQTNTPY